MPIVKVDIDKVRNGLDKKDWRTFDAMTDEDIAGQIVDNPDAAPELDEAWFARAAVMDGDKMVRPGRPKLERPKVSITLRVDADIVERLRATGHGWQSRINDLLRQHLAK